MAKMCITLTMVATLPSSIRLAFRPSKRGFLLALINSSLAFFLFSFQVHEKSILIVALPVLLYFPYDPKTTFWFLQISTFSMFPLLHKDKLIYGFVGMVLFYHMYPTLFPVDSKRDNIRQVDKYLDYGYVVSMFGGVGLVLCYMFVPPPINLPHLFSLLLSAYCCAHFFLFLAYFNHQQFTVNGDEVSMKKYKKL